MRRPSGTREMPSATRRCAGVPPSDRPSNPMSPPRTGTRPLMAFSSVDLPAPLAPMMATASPSSTVRSTPKSAWNNP